MEPSPPKLRSPDALASLIAVNITPVAGVVFLASGLILLCSGALAELIYSRGDMRDSEFIRLTQDIRPRRGAA